MAFPNNSTILDDFNRANNASVGAGYTADPLGVGRAIAGIVSNAAAFTAGGDYNDAYQAAGSYAAAQEVWAEFATIGSDRCYLMARKGAGAVYVLLQYNSSNGSVAAYQSSLDPLGGNTVAVGDRPGAGDAIGLECVGATLNFWIRKGGVWTLNQSFTTTTLGAGVVGFGVAQNGPTLDNLRGGESAGGGGGDASPAFFKRKKQSYFVN